MPGIENLERKTAAILGLAWLSCWSLAGTLTPREQALQEFRDETRGVGYQPGACSQDNMDCSCLVQRLYLEKFALPLPRTTLTQVKLLEDRHQRQLGFEHPSHLVPKALCPGDLIYTHQGSFWERSSRHVVVYLGHGHVLHASARKREVSVDPLNILQHYQLRGVYRPLGCRGGAVPASVADEGSRDEKAVERLIEEFFASWKSRDLEAYSRFWRPRALQWVLGNLLDLPQILHRREVDLEGLQSAEATYRQHSLDVFGQRALVEVVYDLERTYRTHRRIDDNLRESFVLQKDGGSWGIVYSETYFEGD